LGNYSQRNIKFGAPAFNAAYVVKILPFNSPRDSGAARGFAGGANAIMSLSITSHLNTKNPNSKSSYFDVTTLQRTENVVFTQVGPRYAAIILPLAILAALPFYPVAGITPLKPETLLKFSRTSMKLRRIPIFSGTQTQLIEAIKAHLNAHTKPCHIVTLNPEIWVDSATVPEIRTAVTNARWITADGVGITLAQRLLDMTTSPRITGADLTQGLLKQPHLRFFFLGSSEPVLKRAIQRVTWIFPGTIIAGSHHGFFSDTELPAIAAQIRQANPDIILVGMGSPRQDRVIAALETQLTHGILIGVGGVLDVLSGDLKRAPKWMQTMGIEWVWRLALQPKRLGRFLKLVPRFISKLIAERLG